MPRDSHDRFRTVPNGKRDQILNVAERLAQTRGFNGFSYADIAQELLVTKASLHYHFPSKVDLGTALIERYESAFTGALRVIAARVKPPRRKLERYIGLYASVLRDGRMCLCGMFAAEYATLPEPMQHALRRFFDVNEPWLVTVLEQGLHSGVFVFAGTARERARYIMSALEGAMLVARAYEDAPRFGSIAKLMLADIEKRGELASEKIG